MTESNAGDDVVETVTDDVTNDGVEVFEDLITVSDEDGNILAVDDTVGAVDAEGNAVIDETVAVADEDGELHVVSETVEIIQADTGPADTAGTADDVEAADED